MKEIMARTPKGDLIWSITPDATIKSYCRRGKGLSYLDIFYLCGQLLIKNKKPSKHREEAIKRIMIDLNNKVIQLGYFIKELEKKEKNLLSREKRKKKIYDYKHYQIFLGLCEAYLDCLHSMRDLVKGIDKMLGKTYSKKIWKERWFEVQMEIRHLCHHIESPLVYVSDGDILFMFERMNQLRHPPKHLTDEKKDSRGRIEVRITTNDLRKTVIDNLNQWALKHLRDIKNESTKLTQVKGFKKDGSWRHDELTFREFIEKYRIQL